MQLIFSNHLMDVSSHNCSFHTVKQLPNISRRLILELPELIFGGFLLKHDEKHMLHKKNQSIMEGAGVKGCDYPLQKGAKSKKIAARKAARV